MRFLRSIHKNFDCMTATNNDGKVDPSPDKASTTRPCSRSCSRSAQKSRTELSGRGARAMTPAKTSSPKPPVTILEVLNTKRTNDVPKAPHTFAQAAAQPPSPADLTSTEVAIASATAEFTATVRKYQDDFQSLLKSAAPGLVPDSKIKRVRADNVTLTTSATINVQQAGGTRFSLKTLYKIARLEEKEARLYTNKVLAHDSTSTNAKETARMMSSITDSDGYTTVTHHGRSPTSSPPKPRLQSGSKMGNRKNLFDDSFLNTFLLTFATGPAKTHAPMDAVPAAIAQQPTSGEEGKMKEISARSTVISEVGKGGQIYEEPGRRGSSAKRLLALSSTGSSFQVDLDAYVNDPDSRQPSNYARIRCRSSRPPTCPLSLLPLNR
jgi:hypothetical protein